MGLISRGFVAVLGGSVLLATVATPVFAGGPPHAGHHERYTFHGHRHPPPPARYGYYQPRHLRGGEAVALGIVGGIVGLAILDRVIPPPPAFEPGYAAGYQRGYERGRRDRYRADRYRKGRARGYEDGYRAGRY